ncbi:MAG TPA: ergothioneine biosynthesis protein EgtB [Acidimicrobiales bacterium]|jgi:ergothioneine biosynthesis protein EgtB|nr:ergothioneine biosynthesis protein EgtB [Acidimicrobiales bacterium]
MGDLLTSVDKAALTSRFLATRALTDSLGAPLSAEDQTVQSMPDVSPTKWHRAHTAWFFETFLLGPKLKGYQHFHPAYEYLFNSYYEGVGTPYPRDQRGLLSRPGIDDIADYRSHVDGAMGELLAEPLDDPTLGLIDLGIHHEQQHQELLLMDIKNVLWRNPLHPAYADLPAPGHGSWDPPATNWTEHPGGMVDIGHQGTGFAFDNECPRHTELLSPFAIADRPVTCQEWVAFINDGGYRRPELWLSDGWAAIRNQGWDAPLYWTRVDAQWHIFTLGGTRPIHPNEPVCHISYYEADAFARWADARLPSEAEWETAATAGAEGGHFLDLEKLHPTALSPQEAAVGTVLAGDVWSWTSSSYAAYPGFETAAGAVGEYNGKFMVNQYVLRGGSCATPADHVRPTYRNFFPPSARWAFSGLRLARNA